jgi:UDP-N-acetylmuramoyl-tripeptide--D-alanyl-D-alanine ligase
MPVTVPEILEATGGSLVSGPAVRSFSHLHTDSRQVRSGGLFVALRGETQDGHAFFPQAIAHGAGGVLCQVPPGASDGVSVIRVPDTRVALFAITRYRLRRQPVPLVAITGSSGKTTVKDLVAHVLGRRLRVHKSEGNLNTYTGIPMTIFEMDDRDRVLVLEYAMSREGEIRELTSAAPPTIGVVLNVGLAHAGLLGSIEAVARAKRELVEGLADGGVAILNADDSRVRAMASAARRATLFGLAKEASVRAERIRLNGLAGSTFQLRTPRGDAEVTLSLPGQHNVSNALAAAAVAIELDFDASSIASAMTGFRPPERRMNIVSGRGGATLIDDCYNANPSSMRASLEVLRLAPAGSLRVAVLGDMLELGDYAEDAHDSVGRLAAASADRLLAVGAYAPRVVEAARAAGMDSASALAVRDLEDAVDQILPLLRPGTHVLVKGSRGMRMERIVAALAEGG